MIKSDILRVVDKWKRKKGVKLYTPYKYFKGLKTVKDVHQRADEILRGSKTDNDDPNAYRKSAFKTDRKANTKLSPYTKMWYEKYPEKTSLTNKSKVTGVPLGTIKKVYRKGYAAWRTGHRVGATPEEWGYARVHSFLLLGCTAMSADSKLLKDAVSVMKQNDVKRILSQPVQCPKMKLKTPYYKRFEMTKFIKNHTG